jgi:hypothetical protein
MDPGQAELACLLVSEVVTNAVLHASISPSPSRDLDLDIEPMMMPAPVGVPAGPASRAVPAGPAGQVLAGPVPPGRAAVRPAAVPPQQTTGPEGWVGAPPGAPAAPREFRLRLRRGAASVWVEVFDPDLRLPRIRTAGETDEGGRGLYLVEQLATRWGSRPTPEGKAVWFEMPRSGDQP